MNEQFFIYDGNFYREGTPVISTGNRSMMYGDGIFETMRLYKGILMNQSLHFERFFQGFGLMKIDRPENFSEDYFIQKIRQLLEKNDVRDNARVRLMAFRSKADLQNEKKGFKYLLEAWLLEAVMNFEEGGLTTGLFREITKSCDQFSNLKSNNYLPGVMAIIFAKENNFDECLIMNSKGRICESAIANVFIVKDNIIYTPPLSEGCVAGTVRRWLIENLPPDQFQLIQKELSLEEVRTADEMFLTNAIKPVRRVGSFGEIRYAHKLTDRIAEYVFAHMWKVV